jgi:ketosteroid isomerase-like protein
MQTGTEHPNATLVRKGMEAFDRGDIEGYGATLSDDIVWHQIGAPTLNGKQEMAANMPAADTGWSITTEVHDIVANDEHAIALVNAHATRPDGKTLDYRTTEIVHVRDGKVTERWAFSDDTQKIIDFFASFAPNS